MSFIDELKRRKVFRVAASYAVVAFIIMQLVEILFPMFNFPQWTQQFTVIIVLLGFPIAIILSWVFDKTPQGFVKTDYNDTENVGGMNVKVGSRPFFLQKRNIMLVLGVVAGILIGTYGANSFKKTIDKKSIAVLPFDNYSTAEEDQYFSDGMTEVIIANLAKIKDLKVISRTSVMEYKNTTKKLKEIAEELGVAHILEGSIQRASGRVRVVGQLIDADTDEHIWAETYDTRESDLFELQSEVAIQIAQAMKSELTSDEKARIEEKLTESNIAYEYYLKGNMYEHAGHNAGNLKSAIAEYERAVAIDPNFAEAHAQLGKMHAHMKWYRIDLSRKRMERSKESIDIAISLKPENSVVSIAQGTYYYHGFRDYGKALIGYTKAKEFAPNNASSYFYLATVYRRLGDFEKSIEEYKKAVELDPRSWLVMQNMIITYNEIRNYDEALSLLERAKQNFGEDFSGQGLKIRILRNRGELDLAKNVNVGGNTSIFKNITDSYLARDVVSLRRFLSNSTSEIFGTIRFYFHIDYFLGMLELFSNNTKDAKKYFLSAIKHMEKMINDYPDDPRFYASIGLLYARTGNRELALEYGIKATEILPNTRDAMYGPLYEKNLSMIYAILEDDKNALDKIEYLASLESGLHYGELLLDPSFDSLRNEPRFQSVLNKLKPQS